MVSTAPKRAEKTPDAIREGRLLNTVAHHHHTLERERALGVDHWDVAEYRYVCHIHEGSGMMGVITVE